MGSTPDAIARNPFNGDMYVANRGSNTVSVIDDTTNLVTATIPVGSTPYGGIAFNEDNGDTYVTNAGSNTVSVIDGTNTVMSYHTCGSISIWRCL